MPFEEVLKLADIYVKGRAVISTWGMGLTQHKNSVPTVQLLSNLMMMRGNIGRRGAGLCPVRGHSNVQGDRTVGIEEKPTQAFLDRLGEVYDFEPPREHGLDVVEHDSGDARRQGEGVHRPGRQFFDCDAGHAAHVGRDAFVRSDRAHHDQAEPQPPRFTAATR